MKECDDNENPDVEGFEDIEEEDLPFGPWLRASSLPRRNYGTRKDSQSTCGRSLFVSSSSSKFDASGKSRDDIEVLQPSKSVQEKPSDPNPVIVVVKESAIQPQCEPTPTNLIESSKVIEEVAESFGTIDITPKLLSELPKVAATSSKPKAKKKWTRQKSRKASIGKNTSIKNFEGGKRQLFDVLISEVSVDEL